VEIVAGLLFIGLIVYITTKVIRYIDKQSAIAARLQVQEQVDQIEKDVAKLSRSALLYRLRPAPVDSDDRKPR